MVGLDNAGKTATVRGITGESPQDVASTVGFSKVDLKQRKFEVTVFDLGGGQTIRGIWKHYYSDSYGVVFVVDSSDVQRIQETRKTMAEVLQHPRIAGKPILVLANKQDREGALYEGEIIETLSLQKLVNKNKCLCEIKPCSAVWGYGKNVDKSIINGLNWLLNNIGEDYEAITDRVQKDIAEQRAQEELDRKERAETVRRIREERERLEREEAECEGRQIQEEDPDENMPNTFQPIDNVITENSDKENETKRQRELEECRANGPKADDDHGEEEREEDSDEESDDARQMPENADSGKQGKKTNRKLNLKRKHRVDPLRTAESPTPPPPPEFYRKPLPPR